MNTYLLLFLFGILLNILFSNLIFQVDVETPNQELQKQVLKDLPMFAKNSELLEDWATEAASDMYFQHDHFEVYNGLNDIDDQDGMELSYTISDLCTKAYEEKVEPILSDIASDFEDILQKQEDYWYSDEYIKEECAVREILFDKDGNMVDDLMFYGKGAGKLPTASAVVADIVDAAKHKGTNIMTIWNREKIDLKAKEDVRVTYFVRLEKADEGLETRVCEIFGEVKEVEALNGEYAFVTRVMKEKHFAEKLEALGDVKVLSKIRVQE